MIEPDGIELFSLSKKFDYEKISREIDNCSNVDILKTISKGYVKLYLSTLETITELSKI